MSERGDCNCGFHAFGPAFAHIPSCPYRIRVLLEQEAIELRQRLEVYERFCVAHQHWIILDDVYILENGDSVCRRGWGRAKRRGEVPA